jgi:hypothetical protein
MSAASLGWIFSIEGEYLMYGRLARSWGLEAVLLWISMMRNGVDDADVYSIQEKELISIDTMHSDSVFIA